MWTEVGGGAVMAGGRRGGKHDGEAGCIQTDLGYLKREGEASEPPPTPLA